MKQRFQNEPEPYQTSVSGPISDQEVSAIVALLAEESQTSHSPTSADIAEALNTSAENVERLLLKVRQQRKQQKRGSVMSKRRPLKRPLTALAGVNLVVVLLGLLQVNSGSFARFFYNVYQFWDEYRRHELLGGSALILLALVVTWAGFHHLFSTESNHTQSNHSDSGTDSGSQQPNGLAVAESRTV